MFRQRAGACCPVVPGRAMAYKTIDQCDLRTRAHVARSMAGIILLICGKRSSTWAATHKWPFVWHAAGIRKPRLVSYTWKPTQMVYDVLFVVCARRTGIASIFNAPPRPPQSCSGSSEPDIWNNPGRPTGGGAGPGHACHPTGPYNYRHYTGVVVSRGRGPAATAHAFGGNYLNSMRCDECAAHSKHAYQDAQCVGVYE